MPLDWVGQRRGEVEGGMERGIKEGGEEEKEERVNRGRLRGVGYRVVASRHKATKRLAMPSAPCSINAGNCHPKHSVYLLIVFICLFIYLSICFIYLLYRVLRCIETPQSRVGAD